MLAVGAMALLMLGAFRGERAADADQLARDRAAGRRPASSSSWLPAGKLVAFGGSFVVDGFARFLKLLTLIGSAAAILMSLDYLAREQQRAVRVSDPDPARRPPAC